MDNETVARLSFRMCESLAKKGKPFSDGEFIKECLDIFADMACPEKKGSDSGY